MIARLREWLRAWLGVPLALPAPEPATSCSDCVFWSDPVGTMGSCHFNPPPWPATRGDQWCGRGIKE